MTPNIPGAAPSWFPHLGTPSGPHDQAWVMGDGPIHGSPLVTRKPITIIHGFGEGDRGVQSFDPPFLDFVHEYVEVLNEDAQVGVDKDGFQLPGHLHTDFATLETVAGYSMAPMSLAPRDNTSFVDSLGLPSTFLSPRHAAIFDKFADLIFSRWKVTSIKTAKLSTAGSPTWVASAKMKREHALFILAEEDKIRSLYGAGDLVGLAAFAKVTFLMNAGRRDQMEKKGKKRMVFPLVYAASSGRKGEPVEADKRVIIDGVEYDTFSATRARLFHGAPYATNLYPQIIATGTLHGGMFDQFPETFHCVNVREAIEAIPTDEDMRCSDATEYDRSMRTFLIKRLFARAREFWPDDIIDWCEHLAFCAYFSRPVNLDDPRNKGFTTAGEPNRAVLMGNVFSTDDQVQRGNPSGHAWTSLIAKFMMVFDFLATADDLMHDVLEEMVAYLRHRKMLKTKNNGDDGMYHGPTKLLNIYVDYRFNKEKNPGYFVLEAEIGNVWSGFVTERRPEGGFKAYQRPQTSIGKILCPERSAGSNFRKRPTIGIIQRINGNDHPYQQRMFELFFKTWRDTAAKTYGSFMDMVNRHHERLDMDFQALTAIDIAVLEKPELLYYRYTEEDVSPAVISMLFEQALSPAEIMPFVTKNYKGEIIGDKYGSNKELVIH